MTTTAHIVRNQDGHYWGRGKRWVDGGDTTRVMSFAHQDEAVNTVFELSSKDVDLRCDVLSLNLSEGKLPKLEISSIPLPAEPDDEGDLEMAPLSTPSQEDTVSKENNL